MTNRSNDSWIADLSADGDRRDAAVTDLRAVLVRGLRQAFKTTKRVDEAFVEDSAQDSLVAILAKLDQFEGRSKFTTWALSIGVRTAISELRRKRWKDVSLADITAEDRSEADVAVDDTERVEVSAEKQEVFTSLLDAIDKALTDKQKFALRAELAGVPQARIAEDLGSNRNAVYKLMHDARKKLLAALDERGVTSETISELFA
ncbi:MAG: RNA polymerase sigma factor [Planctomycetota bacterium]